MVDERALKISTVDCIHTVLKLAVEDNYVRQNVSDNMMQELCGHSSLDVTLDIYITVTKELKQK